MKNLIIYNYYIWFTFESTNHRLFDEHSYYSNWHSLSSNSFGCTFFRGTVRGPSVVGGGFTIITEQEQRIVLEEEKNETNQTQHRRMLFTLLFKKSMKNDRLFAVNWQHVTLRFFSYTIDTATNKLLAVLVLVLPLFLMVMHPPAFKVIVDERVHFTRV